MYRGHTPITVVQESGPPVLNPDTGMYETPTVETVLWGDWVPTTPELVQGAGSLLVQSRVMLPPAYADMEANGGLTAILDPRGKRYGAGTPEPHYLRGRLHHFEAVVQGPS